MLTAPVCHLIVKSPLIRLRKRASLDLVEELLHSLMSILAVQGVQSLV